MRAPSRSEPTEPDQAVGTHGPRLPLATVRLDAASIGHGSPEQEHERKIAIFDLVEGSAFAVPGRSDGPYTLLIGMRDAKLALDVLDQGERPVVTHLLSLSPFRSLLRDYRLICETYYAAIRTATPSQIETIDMGRKGLHDEAATLLADRLAGKIDADFATFRRLFTLVAALHWKG